MNRLGQTTSIVAEATQTDFDDEKRMKLDGDNFRVRFIKNKGYRAHYEVLDDQTGEFIPLIIDLKESSVSAKGHQIKVASVKKQGQKARLEISLMDRHKKYGVDAGTFTDDEDPKGVSIDVGTSTDDDWNPPPQILRRNTKSSSKTNKVILAGIIALLGWNTNKSGPTDCTLVTVPNVPIPTATHVIIPETNLQNVQGPLQFGDAQILNALDNVITARAKEMADSYFVAPEVMSNNRMIWEFSKKVAQIEVERRLKMLVSPLLAKANQLTANMRYSTRRLRRELKDLQKERDQLLELIKDGDLREKSQRDLDLLQATNRDLLRHIQVISTKTDFIQWELDTVKANRDELKSEVVSLESENRALLISAQEASIVTDAIQKQLPDILDEPILEEVSEAPNRVDDFEKERTNLLAQISTAESKIEMAELALEEAVKLVQPSFKVTRANNGYYSVTYDLAKIKELAPNLVNIVDRLAKQMTDDLNKSPNARYELPPRINLEVKERFLFWAKSGSPRRFEMTLMGTSKQRVTGDKLLAYDYVPIELTELPAPSLISITEYKTTTVTYTAVSAVTVTERPTETLRETLTRTETQRETLTETETVTGPTTTFTAFPEPEPETVGRPWTTETPEVRETVAVLINVTPVGPMTTLDTLTYTKVLSDHVLPTEDAQTYLNATQEDPSAMIYLGTDSTTTDAVGPVNANTQVYIRQVRHATCRDPDFLGVALSDQCPLDENLAYQWFKDPIPVEDNLAVDESSLQTVCQRGRILTDHTFCIAKALHRWTTLRAMKRTNIVPDFPLDAHETAYMAGRRDHPLHIATFSYQPRNKVSPLHLWFERVDDPTTLDELIASYPSTFDPDFLALLLERSQLLTINGYKWIGMSDLEKQLNEAYSSNAGQKSTSNLDIVTQWFAYSILPNWISGPVIPEAIDVAPVSHNNGNQRNRGKGNSNQQYQYMPDSTFNNAPQPPAFNNAPRQPMKQPDKRTGLALNIPNWIV